MSELTDNINKLTFRVYEEPEGGFFTRCTEFLGIITQGDSKEDLKRMFGDNVTSRKISTQNRELMYRVIAYNAYRITRNNLLI